MKVYPVGAVAVDPDDANRAVLPTGRVGYAVRVRYYNESPEEIADGEPGFIVGYGEIA